MRECVLAKFNTHRDKAALWILGNVCRGRTIWHQPIRFQRDNAIGSRHLHARGRTQISVRRAGDAPEELRDWSGYPLADRDTASIIPRLSFEDSFEEKL